MANQDPQKVYVSFNGRSVTGWGEDGPVIQRPERVQTNWGLQGYSESQQHYDGDRTITLNLYVSSEGYQYNSDNPITYRVDVAQVKQLGDVQPGTNNQIEVTWDCASEIEED